MKKMLIKIYILTAFKKLVIRLKHEKHKHIKTLQNKSQIKDLITSDHILNIFSHTLYMSFSFPTNKTTANLAISQHTKTRHFFAF